MTIKGLARKAVRRFGVDIVPYDRKDHPSSSIGWAKDGAFAKRQYGSYEEYLEHQASKLTRLTRDKMKKYDSEYRKTLRERLGKLGLLRGSSILCLAARLGTECKAFIDVGCFPIGIDLNPGDENHYVVHGDFHKLQFADASIDYCFTNALDHAFDFKKIINEVSRVLKPSGGFIAEISDGSKDNPTSIAAEYEAMWWERVDDIVKDIRGCGFEVARREKFSLPWDGEQVVFRKYLAS